MAEIPTLEIDKAILGLKQFKGRAVGFLTLTKAKAELCALIDECAKEIDQAYIEADGDLTVALGLKMAGTRLAGEIELTTSINFVKIRIKRATKVIINEKQMSLPGVKK